MKKFLALLLCAAMLTTFACAEGADVFTSASTTNYYGMIEGDELMNALNSYTGFYLICTTNPDGTANGAFFIYGCVKCEDKYYLQLGLAPNQSTQNLAADGRGTAIYAANPTDKEYATNGARMTFKVVTDEATLAKLAEAGANTTAIMAEILEVRPLG